MDSWDKTRGHRIILCISPPDLHTHPSRVAHTDLRAVSLAALSLAIYRARDSVSQREDTAELAARCLSAILYFSAVSFAIAGRCCPILFSHAPPSTYV